MDELVGVGEWAVPNSWGLAPGLNQIADLIADDVIGMYTSLAYYDREGNRISLRQAFKLSGDPEYSRLRRTRVPGGEVSSFWMGSDFRDGEEEGEPLIYGTTFLRDDDLTRYVTSEYFATAEETIAFHEQLVGSIVASMLSTFMIFEERSDNHAEQANQMLLENATPVAR